MCSVHGSKVLTRAAAPRGRQCEGGLTRFSNFFPQPLSPIRYCWDQMYTRISRTECRLTALLYSKLSNALRREVEHGFESIRAQNARPRGSINNALSTYSISHGETLGDMYYFRWFCFHEPYADRSAVIVGLGRATITGFHFPRLTG